MSVNLFCDFEEKKLSQTWSQRSIILFIGLTIGLLRRLIMDYLYLLTGMVLATLGIITLKTRSPKPVLVRAKKRR